MPFSIFDSLDWLIPVARAVAVPVIFASVRNRRNSRESRSLANRERSGAVMFAP